MPNYKYVRKSDIAYNTEIYGRAYENKWVKLTPDGMFVVKKHYAWDGCSPKWKVFDWGYIGTWDGTLDMETGLPITGTASCLHDALLQFSDEMGVWKAEAAREFCKELERKKFSLRKLYCWAVRTFGPQD